MISFLLALVLLFNPSFPQKSNNYICKNIIHIGDSLTANGYDYYVNDYKRIGFFNPIVSAGGSRSFTSKRTTDQFTGLQAVKHYKNKYPKSTCWILSLGTNDSGYVSAQYAKQTIIEVMSIINKDKVIWTNVWKGKSYNLPKAKIWNKTLTSVLSKYPNSVILNWAQYVRTHKDILGPDGVHYTGLGYQQRSKFISSFAKHYFSKSYSTK